MKIKSIFFLLTLACSSFVASGKNKNTEPYKNKDLSIEKRVNDLLKRMTLEEKVYQLCPVYLSEGDEIYKSTKEYSIDRAREFILKGYGSVSIPTREMYARKSAETVNSLQRIAMEESRLGIPLLLNEEALHGMVGRGACSFPQPIALASTWDLELMTKIGDAIGKEISTRGCNQVLSPTLDLGRDPRHGRFTETYGEDPLLVALMGGEYIKEVQKYNIACTPKHLLANFVGEGGREGANIEFSERALRETHLYPFEYAIKECDVLGVMPAYNAINGIPCHANKWLMDDVFRKEWGFKGLFVSDWSGVMHLSSSHYVANGLEDAAVLAVSSGVDIDLPRGACYPKLYDAVNNKKISEKDIDQSVRRILWLKFRLGLFENPYADPQEAEKFQDHKTHRNLALEAAQKSIVLLKNDGTLPINNNIKKIAVIGPNANVVRLGQYSATGVKAVSPLQGLKNMFGDDVEINYEQGVDIKKASQENIDKAKNIANNSDLTIMFMGGSDWGTGAESQDRADLKLMGKQEEFIRQIAELGKPIVVVLVDGRPVIVRDWIDKVNALVMMWFAGEEGGNAIAGIIKGDVNPSGKLPCSFPMFTGQLPLYYSHYPFGRESHTAEIIGQKNNKKRYDPQFPFGYGLSYTSFEYSDIEVKNNNSLKPELTIKIKNTGDFDGDEVVQLYLTSKISRIVRPVKQLRYFERVSLKPGEEKSISFNLQEKDFMIMNENSKPELDKGEYTVLIGKDSQNGKSTIINVK